MMRIVARSLVFALLVVSAVFYSTSCTPDDPPTPTQIVITPPPSGAKAVTLRVSATEIPADGSSSVLITGTCTVGGQKAPDNLPVTFTTDAGDFSRDGVEGLADDKATHQVSIYTVDGTVQIYLISESVPGSATVRALFGNEGVDSIVINFVRTGDEIEKLELTVTPSSGQSPLTAQVEATVKGEDDTPLQGVTVRFRVTDDSAKIDKQKVKTDTNGVAPTFIRNITEDCVVKANASGLQALELVSITNDEAEGIKLEVKNTSGGLAGQDPVLINTPGQLLLKATVTGSDGSVSGVPVGFSSTDGSTSFSPQTVNTDSAGEAETFANNIRNDSTITAQADSATDSLSVKINRAPIARISTLSGSAVADEVAVFTFSAENSFDPDQAYGDKIETYTWAFTLESSVGAEFDTSNTSNPQIITVTVGEFGGTVPADGDVFTVFLTVVDTLGLQRTAVATFTFAP